MTKPILGPLQTDDYAQTRYFLKVEGGISIDDVMDRRFWVNVTKQLTAGAIVSLRADDNAWYGEVLVLNVVVTATDVHIPTFALLSYVDLTKARKSGSSDAFTVKFNGADKFVIIRNADKEKIEKGIATKEAAEARLAELMAA